MARSKPKGLAHKGLARKRRDRGFILPIAIGLGLIILLIGVVVVLRSQTDRNMATLQSSTASSLTAAETGISRLQTLLGKYRAISTYPACVTWAGNTCADDAAVMSWKNPGNLPDLNSGCPQYAGAATDIPAAVTRDWQPIDNDPKDGEYRLVDYTYDPSGQGQLTVEGRVNQAVGSNIAATRLTVGIPIGAPSSKSGIPALWLSDASSNIFGDDKFKGNIVINNCTLPASDPSDANLADPQQFQRIAILLPFPNIPSGTLTPITSDELWSQPLPLNSSDPQNSSGRYVYRVDDVSAFQQNATDPTKIIQIEPGKKVDLFIEGNIDISNDASINEEGSPSQLRIIGSPTTTLVRLNGNGFVKALIFAKEATGSITNGKRTAESGEEGYFKGSLWLKHWTDAGTSSNPVLADAVGSFEDYDITTLPAYPLRAILGGVGTWTRQQVSP